ncbi:MAG: peptide ABC transporter substrate-binding protein [Nevskiales bacterium]|nr:peptide ABC transporter substrate-binding protein [Nevskiales bacterium]
MRQLLGGLLLAAVLCAHAEVSVLRLGNGPEPETLDPQRAEGVSAANILRDLYEGLTRIAPDGRVIAGAAESWSISEDGRTYRFELRPDARWSNGDPVTAEDFVAGLRRTVTPATGSSYAQMLGLIEGAGAIIEGKAAPETLAVRAVSAHTLEMRLSAPAPYWLGLLSHASTYPVHRPSLAQYGADFARAGRLVGNGAYMLDDWGVQSHVRLRRNPNYWRARDVSIDVVEYFPTEDLNSEYKRYLAGELDVTYEVPPVLIPKIRRQLGDELRVAPYLGVYYYGLNLTRPPLAGNKPLRQALSLAIDREVIASKLLHGLGLPAESWIPPETSGHLSLGRPPASPWTERQAEARRLYRASGYGPDRPLRLEIRYNTNENHRRIATVIAAMWRQVLGVQTSLVNEEFKVFLSNRKLKADTQVFRAAWIADFDDPLSFAEILTSGNGQNDTGWSDPEYDRLIERARRTADPERRARLLQAAERRVLDEVPVIPIYFYTSKHLIKPHVAGWTDNMLDYHYSQDLRILPAAP